MDDPADLVLRNAIIHRGGLPPGRVDALAVKDGIIRAVGTGDTIMARVGPATEVIDCGGQALLPGFVDAHVHLLGLAETFLGVDCSPRRVTSISALQSAIREGTADIAPGEWVRAYGYHPFFLDGGQHPTRWDLDAAASENPVRLLHQNRHICVLNSLALRLAGIDRWTPNPSGGVIEKDAVSGEPTGLLAGLYSWLSQHVVPPLRQDELETGVLLAARSFLSEGVTCIHDASPRNSVAEWGLYGALAAGGQLPVGVRMMVGLEGLDSVVREGLAPRSGDAQLRLGPVKIVVEEIAGRLYPSPRELTAQVRRVHDLGFQLAIHAITPRAVRAAVKAVKALGQGAGAERRHRLEHCTYLPASLIEEMAEAGVVVVSQPSFIYFNGSRYLAEVPPEKFPWVCRGRSLLRRGIPLVGSTDAPVVPNSILTGIGAAVSRESQIGFVFGPREGISVSEGIDMFSRAGAYAAFEEGEAGSIEVGSRADLVLLDRNPLATQPEEIREIRPRMVFIAGKPVWRR